MASSQTSTDPAAKFVRALAVVDKGMVGTGCRVAMDPKTIRTRLQELAFLNSAATIWFRALPPAASPSSSNGNGASAPDSSSSSREASANGAEPHAPAAAGAALEGEDGWEKLHFSGGLREYVAFLNKDAQPMHEPLFFTDKARSPALCEVQNPPWCHCPSPCSVLCAHAALHAAAALGLSANASVRSDPR